MNVNISQVFNFLPPLSAGVAYSDVISGHATLLPGFWFYSFSVIYKLCQANVTAFNWLHLIIVKKNNNQEITNAIRLRHYQTHFTNVLQLKRKKNLDHTFTKLYLAKCTNSFTHAQKVLPFQNIRSSSHIHNDRDNIFLLERINSSYLLISGSRPSSNSIISVYGIILFVTSYQRRLLNARYLSAYRTCVILVTVVNLASIFVFSLRMHRIKRVNK